MVTKLSRVFDRWYWNTKMLDYHDSTITHAEIEEYEREHGLDSCWTKPLHSMAKTFAFLPRRCALSGKLIWFRYGHVVLIRNIRNDEAWSREPIVRIWHDPVMHTAWLLTR